MRFSWLLSAQVQPTPASLTVQPNSGEASTSIHGAGRRLSALKHDDVLAGLRVEAAEAVVEVELRSHERCGLGCQIETDRRTTSGSGRAVPCRAG